MRCPNIKCGKVIKKNSPCKFCKRRWQLEYRRTLNGFLRCKYRSIRDRVRRSNGRLRIKITSDEFYDWALCQPRLHQIYRDWVESNYKSWLSPSVDRINDDLGYEFGNIQITTWRDNYRKECIKKGFDPFAIPEKFELPQEPSEEDICF